MASRRGSSAVISGDTILDTVTDILEMTEGPASPSEIAEIGLDEGLLRVPRGRTKSYLVQLLQSQLYNNAHYSTTPIVRRTTYGRYKALSRQA